MGKGSILCTWVGSAPGPGAGTAQLRVRGRVPSPLSVPQCSRLLLGNGRNGSTSSLPGCKDQLRKYTVCGARCYRSLVKWETLVIESPDFENRHLMALHNSSKVTELFSEGAASRVCRFPGSKFNTLNTIPISKETFACPDLETANLRVVIASQPLRCRANSDT